MVMEGDERDFLERERLETALVPWTPTGTSYGYTEPEEEEEEEYRGRLWEEWEAPKKEDESEKYRKVRQWEKDFEKMAGLEKLEQEEQLRQLLQEKMTPEERKLVTEATKLRAETAIRKRKSDIEWEKAERRKYRGQYRRTLPAVKKSPGKVASLFAPARGTKTRMREFYGTPKLARVHSPESVSGMKELTTLGRGGGTALRQATAPHLGSLKMLTMPSAMTGTRIGQQVSSRTIQPSTTRIAQVARGRTQRAGMERGLTPLEQLAYREIMGNSDIDTPQSVVGELGKLGVPRREARQAVTGLLQKGVVRKGKFNGQQILEVAS